MPRNLLTTRVASASPSISSATISKGRLNFATCSSSGSRSFIELIFFSWIRMIGFSSTTSMRSGSVTKYGERYPRSNCIPSTMSSEVSIVLASSTVMTPSFPTLSIAWAMIVPIVASVLAEMVPTCAIMSPVTGVDIFCRAPTTASTASSIPRLISIGFAPATTFLAPSR